MMKQEAIRLLYFLLAAATIGWFFDHPGWAMVAGLLAYISRHLRNIEKLHRWLRDNPEDEVPEGTGVWDDIFHNIYQLQRDERRARDSLIGIIGRA
ncbi:MAG: DUF3329 domain-containing protein, partial [Moraxellaceae bacterium]|nr:DUF3329 domain-containing protein [Moraxellaceae bacterium]